MIDERKAPGAVQQRTGNTCPEQLDIAQARIEELKLVVYHWQDMWKKADEDNRKAHDLLRRLVECSWFVRDAGVSCETNYMDDVMEVGIFPEFFKEIQDYVSGE
jgi:hypothetical protein